MANAEQTSPAPHRALDAGALRALGHPLRVKIYEAVSQCGSQTASTLAAQLHESTGATSYHLRVLARHGLIVEDPDQPSGRECWWMRAPRGVCGPDQEAPDSPAGETAMQVAVAELLRHRFDEATQYFTTRVEQEPSAWRDASGSTAVGVPMTAAQTKELTDRIQAVIDEAAAAYRGQTGDGVRHVNVHVDIFPLEAHHTRQEQES